MIKTLLWIGLTGLVLTACGLEQVSTNSSQVPTQPAASQPTEVAPTSAASPLPAATSDQSGQTGTGVGEIELLRATYARDVSSDFEPIDPGDEFGPMDPVYLVLDFKGRPKEGLVTATFYYKEQKITSLTKDFAEANGGVIASIGQDTYMVFKLTPNNPFPAGDEYRTEVFVNDSRLDAYPFKVVDTGVATSSTPSAGSSITRPTSASAATTQPTSASSAATDNIQLIGAVYARDVSDDFKAIDPTLSFGPTDTVYLVLQFKGQPKQGRVKVILYFNDQEVTSSNDDFANSKNRGIIPDGQSDYNTNMGFSFTSNDPLPISNEYRTLVFINDVIAGSFPFSVVDSNGVTSSTPSAGSTPRPTSTGSTAPQPTSAASDTTGSEFTISGNGETVTRDCANGTVTVAGNNNTVTLSGTCQIVLVTGNANIVTLDTIGILWTTGNDNTVTWKAATFGDEPNITDAGTGNKVQRR